MKKFIVIALAACALAPAFAATNVGVSIGINQPGVYGRIDLGSYPQPQVYSTQPVIVQPPPMGYARQPIYLYVPPLHQQNWARYCSRYAACGQPVYFVQENWVRERYMHEHPGWRGDRRDRHDERRDHEDRRDRDDHHGRG
jgi:hypothetical protein